jgi:ATP-dependent Clp protease ATP-binding subunit ClpC
VFERFTDRARRVVVLAQEEARTLEHNYIGTEHILLGILHEGEGVASKALETLGVPLDGVRKEIESTIGRGEGPATGHVPFTPGAKKVLELSLREALELGHSYIGTEHLLLGLVREGEGVASQVLVKMGAGLEKVREAVVRELSGYATKPEAEPAARTSSEGPLCPRCRKPLAETAAYRVMDVLDAEREGERSTFTFVFCGGCGTSLGTVS